MMSDKSLSPYSIPGTGSRLAATLEKVINTEVSLRTGDLNLVEQNINTVREYLNKLRQGICADYYDDNFKTTLQKPPHRAVKSTFKGKTPIKRETEDADSATASYSQSSIGPHSLAVGDEVTIKQEPVDDLGSTPAGSKDEPQLRYIDLEEKSRLAQEAEKRRPRYIPPVLPINQIQQSLEPRGNQLMKKIRFLVRNNSKYIMTPEDTSGCTYKWSLNVKLNDESCDISDIVSKVIFYLHPSYKPNDVITLTSPPFKITRRGWGEFNLRIKIFFTNEKDEPVDISHRLVFDKLCSGMETFGGETVFDHWIIDPASRKSVPDGGWKPSEEKVSNKTAPKRSPTVMTTEDSASSLLSAFFGEMEEQTAKKDSEWGQDIFELSDLAFPEFFSSPIKSQSGNESCRQAQPEGHETSTDESTPASIHVKPATEPRTSTTESPAVDAAGPATHPGPKIEKECLGQDGTVELDHNLVKNSEAEQNTDLPQSLTEAVTIKTEPVEQEELYLSDLSMFDDEVIISESVEAVEELKTIDEGNPVDYNAIEMDDLIQFPGKTQQVTNPSPTSTSDQIPQSAASSGVVAVKKENVSSPLQISANKVSQNKKSSKNPLVTSQVHPVKSIERPLAKVQASPQLRSIAPLPGGTIPISAVLANLPPPAGNKGSVVYVVAPSGVAKSSQVVPANVARSMLNRTQQTLLVSSSELPKIMASQNCTPTLVMTSKVGQSPAMTRVNSRKSKPGVPGPGISTVPAVLPQRPILIKTDGKPLSLISATSLPGAVTAKPSTILVQSPKAGSQPTTVLAAPSGVRPLLQRPVAPAPLKPNLGRGLPPRPKTISVRPGGTQFLLKMPDGTLKPIKMESLKPLQHGNVKLRIAPSLPAGVSKVRPQLLQKVVDVQKRPAPSQQTVPAKRSRFPVPTLPGMPGPSLNRFTPSTSSAPVNHFTKPSIGVGVNSSHDDSADPEPQGMNSLKRGPPETEEVDTSSFRNERMLIELCPKDSIMAATKFLMKRLPLIDGRSRLEAFKQAFPYCAPDLTTFRSWPFAKQRAHEVLRANDVLRLVTQAISDCDYTKWEMLRIARMRGFTPLTKKIDTSFLPQKPLDVDDPPTDLCLNSLKALWGPEQEPDEEIDIVNETDGVPDQRVPPVDEKLDKKGKEFMTLGRHVGDGAIVEKWVQDASIYLDPEELAPGILFPASLRLFVSAFHSFAEDLLRSSYTSAFLRYESSEPRVLTPQDVRLALRSRPEFDLFTNIGLGTKYRQARAQPEDPEEEDRRLRNAEKVS